MEISQILGENRELLFIIISRSGKLMGHLIRYNSFIINIMKGIINVCKGRGRPRKIFILGEMIEIITGCNDYSHMKTLALKRD